MLQIKLLSADTMRSGRKYKRIKMSQEGPQRTRGKNGPGILFVRFIRLD